MAETWKVVRNNPARPGQTTTLVEGTEWDCRKALANAYPRMHVEPGSVDEPTPDAWLVSPDGEKEVHYGSEYVDESGEYEDGFGPHPDDVTYEDDDEVEETPKPKRSSTPKKKTAPAFSGKGE